MRANSGCRLLAVRSRNRAIFLVIDRNIPEEQQHKLQFQVHTRDFHFFIFLIQICHDGDYPFDYLARYDNHCGWGFNTDQVWAVRWERLDRTNRLSSGEHMLNGQCILWTVFINNPCFQGRSLIYSLICVELITTFFMPV